MNWMAWTPDTYVSASGAWECRRQAGGWFLAERRAAKPRARGPFRNLLAAMDAAPVDHVIAERSGAPLHRRFG